MSNVLDEAASALATGHWCTGNIKDGDKFCAVGAIAWFGGQYDVVKGEVEDMIKNEPDLTAEEIDDEYDMMFENSSYKFVREHPAGKALAEEIMASPFFNEVKADFQGKETHLEKYMERGFYDDVIVDFNDSQETAEPVVEMFRKAAKRLDSKS